MPTINFAMEHQQHSNWCWAAVAVSVDHFFSKRSTWCQCRVASRMAKLEKITVTNCGDCKHTKKISQKCNVPWYLDKALRIVRRLNGKPKPLPLSFAALEKKLKAGRPVCVRVRWGRGPAAHFVVVSGCETGPGGHHWVDVDDPFAGSSTWLYDEFRDDYQYAKGHWSATYPVK
jgi:hypothetical protein